MESLRRLTSSIFDGESRLSLGRRGSISNGILSPNSESAALAAQRFAPSDLDLTFITNRLIVMGFPVQGPTDKKHNQNNIDDLAEYLEMHHSNQYLIFNLNSLEEDLSALVQVQELDSFISSASLTSNMAGGRKQTSVVAEKVRQQIVEFAWERDGMKAHTPPFEHIFRICYAIFAWLSLDASNLALINCQTGKTRSGIVVASYLLYARLADDPIEAFVEFYRKRWDMKTLTSEALRLKTPQSIQRFLTGFHDLIENQRIPNDEPLMLKGIILRSVPVEYQPCIQIWDDYRLTYCTSDGPQQADSYENTQNGPVVDWDCEDGCLAILWEDGLDLEGGFSIMCSFGDEYDVDEASIDPSSKVLFRYTDSTWFLTPGLITLAKSKLDIMKQYEEAFSDEYFSMDLVFVESKKARRKNVPIDLSGNAAVRQGVVEIAKHHVVLPDPGMHSNFMKMGFSDAATTFALQRSQNAPNIALDILHSSVITTCFGQATRSSESSGTGLPSYSSASLLGKHLQHSDTAEFTRQPVARRQSTAEIAALQSQRTRYSTPTVDVSSVCNVCKDDDYMMRPQVVKCTGPCGCFYHTTCVGLKRIPFGLTTLSDRTNHSVYLKKYFNAWQCDSCSSSNTHEQDNDERSLGVPSRGSPLGLPYVTGQARAKIGSESAETSITRASVQTSSAASTETSDHVEDGQMDRLKEFLAISGVSVEDLLRAATTANVAISPSETPRKPAPESEQHAHKPASPTAGALQKLFSTAHGNPQDSAPKQDSSLAEKGRILQHTTSTLLPTSHVETTARSAAVSEQPRPISDQPTTSASTQQEEHKFSSQVITSVDPKAALLAQITSRSKSSAPSPHSTDPEPTQPIETSTMSNPAQTAPADETDKYQRMLKRGVPFEAVQNCMVKDGIDPSRLVAPSASVVENKVKESQKETDEPTRTKLKDMKEFSNYFNMLRIGCPKPAVTQKMIMDGADPVVLELGPDAIYDEVKDKIKIASSSDVSTLQDDIKSVKSHKKVVMSDAANECETPRETEKEAGPAEIALKDHEVYSKYFKMLKMGLPMDAVQHKIQRDGNDIRALELGGDASYSKLVEKSNGIKLSDDPIYSKFFKMLKMGLPKDAVRHKMEMEGANVQALELGPDAFVSQLTATKASLAKSPPTKPKVRRKKLHWQPISDDRLSNTNRQTIWEDRDEEGVDFDMDMDEIESLFFASSDAGKKKVASGQGKAMKRKQSVTLIDGKRAMNAAISLARVKLSYAEIANAISVFDANGLTVEQLRGIHEFLPTAEEVALVSNYSGDVALLGEAEKFIMEISKVKRYATRTECLLFRVSFSPRYQELNLSLENLINACQQVKESRLLKILLSMVLKLGNTLNGSGEENGIRGFTVDSLLRLGHTKAVNQKTTVLHYLIRVVKKNHPAVLDFHSELKSVPLAARESFESIDEDFGKLQSGLTLLSEAFQEIQKDEMDKLAHETVDALRGAVDDIGGQMEILDLRIKSARDQVQSVLEYFGEDPAKNVSSFFTTLTSFCGMFEVARKEVDAADETQQRAERMKMRRNVSMRPTQTSASSGRGVRLDRERATSDRGFATERLASRISEDDSA